MFRVIKVAFTTKKETSCLISFHFLSPKLYFSSASGMYKIVRPAVGESLRYQHLKVPGIHLALQLNFVCLPFFLVFIFREMPMVELKNKYRKMASLEKARSCWEDEYEVSSKQVWTLKELM